MSNETIEKFVGVLQDPDTDYCELEISLSDFITFAEQHGPVHVRQVDGWTFYSNCPITGEMISSVKGD